MSRLFIIGNGFDLAHRIPSKYEDFRLYLISLLNKESGCDYSNYDFRVNNDIVTDNYIKNLKNDILTIMFFLSNAEDGTEWKNIEHSVGRLNYDEFSWLYLDESEDEKEQRANYINEDIFLPYRDVLASIPDFFSKWIKQININEDYRKYVSCELSSLFDDKTKCICFNYTDTLEYLYNIQREKICYIHGKAKDNSILYFGHGNSVDYQDYLVGKNVNWLSTAEGEWMVDYALRKPVEHILNENSTFFESIKDVDEVYSLGFSYGSVDKPYIEKIISKISINAKWMINKFPSDKEKEDYKNIIRECGYKGTIGEF